MRARWSIIILAVLFISVFIGCESDGNNPNPNRTKPPQNKYGLTDADRNANYLDSIKQIYSIHYEVTQNYYNDGLAVDRIMKGQIDLLTGLKNEIKRERERFLDRNHTEEDIDLLLCTSLMIDNRRGYLIQSTTENIAKQLNELPNWSRLSLDKFNSIYPIEYSFNAKTSEEALKQGHTEWIMYKFDQKTDEECMAALNDLQNKAKDTKILLLKQLNEWAKLAVKKSGK